MTARGSIRSWPIFVIKLDPQANKALRIQYEIKQVLHFDRFASFVEGNSHLNDDEVLDYESYAFSMDRSRSKPVANSTRNMTEISDDDASETDDDD